MRLRSCRNLKIYHKHPPPGNAGKKEHFKEEKKMKRDMHYKMKSLEELLKAYASENDRINKEEAETTKKLIVNEVYARIKDIFDLLEVATESDVQQIYKQLIERKGRK